MDAATARRRIAGPSTAAATLPRVFAADPLARVATTLIAARRPAAADAPEEQPGATPEGPCADG